ncbi:MAG TPA: nucleotide exchange factor GrpE [Gammaproteobacteria bacterium]|nr:nucleotide exchange factor GrpE [Gammaproteobacteria bacterium]
MTTQRNTPQDDELQREPYIDTDTAGDAPPDPGADSQAEGEDTDGTGGEELAAELERARAKAEENWDLLLRARAELDNVKRRAERDVEQARKFALERFVAELLPVKDSLEMGIQAAGDGEQQDQAGDAESQIRALREGSELTLKMFTNVLEKFGVEEVDPQGEPFNPDVHEAVSMQQSAEAEPGSVVAVMQKGYLLNKRVIRPAMVVVAQAPDDGADQ